MLGIIVVFLTNPGSRKTAAITIFTIQVSSILIRNIQQNPTNQVQQTEKHDDAIVLESLQFLLPNFCCLTFVASVCNNLQTLSFHIKCSSIQQLPGALVQGNIKYTLQKTK